MTDREDGTPAPNAAQAAARPARGKLDGTALEPKPQDNMAKGRKGG